MNICIIGAGKFGSEIAKQLSLEGHNITVIDNDADCVENVVNQYDVSGLLGNGTSYDALKEAGIEGYDFLIAVTGNDEVNIVSCIIAKHLNIKHTIARIRNKDYSGHFELLKDQLGVDYAVNPDTATSESIFNILKFPGADQVETFANGNIEIVGVKIKDNPVLTGVSLTELRVKHNVTFLVCVVKRGNDIFIPKGDFVLQEGDFVYLTANREDMISSFKKLGLFKTEMKNVFIIGGGKTGEYLAESLLKNHFSVKVFEKDQARCEYLSDELKGAVIVKSDGLDQKNFLEEGFERADSVVALTGDDEDNIVVSAYAKKFNIKKVITKIGNIDYDLVTGNFGLDSIVCPKDVFASFVIRYVREFDGAQSRSSEFISLYRLLNNRVEATEFEISKATDFTSKPLKELRLKSTSLIFAILRGGKFITPRGNDTLEVGDRVFVISTGKFLNDLSDIF